MDIKKLLKKTLCNTCIFFTAITLLYMLAVVFINVDDSRITLDAGRMFLFLVFSLLLAIANSVFTMQSAAAWLRLLLHYAICGLAFYLCMLLPLSPTASNTVVGLTFYTVIYFILAGVISFFRARYKKQSADTAEYTKRFSDK